VAGQGVAGEVAGPAGIRLRAVGWHGAHCGGRATARSSAVEVDGGSLDNWSPTVK
jgi:hypothetical protein